MLTIALAVGAGASCSSKSSGAPPDASAAGMLDGPASTDGALADAALADAALPPPPPSPMVQLSAGGDQSCGIREDGTLWCWGSRAGDVYSDSTVPAQIGSDSHWTNVSLQQGGACAIDGGALYCWGGISGVHDPYENPTQIGSATDWTAVAVGWQHTCALRGGALYCWGENDYGEAGSALDTTYTTPTQLGSATDWVAISAGESVTCGLRTVGGGTTLWCWGSPEVTGWTAWGSTPTQLGSATNWKTVAMYGAIGCGLATDGTAWCWDVQSQTPTQISADTDYTAVSPGDYYCGVHGGQLTCLDEYQNVDVIGSGQTWSTVATEGRHTCATDITGAVWCWGANVWGELGIGTRPEQLTYVQTGSDSDWREVSMNLEELFTCGLHGSDLYCWGGAGPWLGNGASNVAEQVPTFVGSGFVDVQAGVEGTCGRKSDGTLWCWGLGTTIGSADETLSPVQIGSDTDWSMVSVSDHTCGIREGALYCWGLNNFGQIGDGTTTDRTVPTQVGSNSDWTVVSTDMEETCGIRGGGLLYCWGGNEGSDLPEQRGSGTTWKSIQTFGNERCGLRQDNTWWCTDEEVSQLNDWTWAGATLGIRGGAVYDVRGGQVGSDTDLTSITGIWSESCGVTTSGTLVCMGPGESGELGNGDAWVLAPTPVL